MKKILKPLSLLALAGLMAVPVTAATSQQAEAGSRDAFVGGLVGGVIGGAIGSARRPAYRQPDVVYVEPRPRRVIRSSGNAHVNWCYSRYRSYDARSDTYQPYRGPRRYCNSPYN